jgi:hypothetical protein
VDRRAGFLTVRATVSDGEIVEMGKTTGSRRQVPLTRRALDALDAIPPRLDTPLIFPAPEGLLAGWCGCRRASGGRRDRRSAGQMTPRAGYLRRAPESSAIDASPTGREAKVPICSVVGVA